MNLINKQSAKKKGFSPLEASLVYCRRLASMGRLPGLKAKKFDCGSKGLLTGFTIVELLTVMSIIVILLGLLVPALNGVRRYSKLVVQKNQFRSIGAALELFNYDWNGYSDSNDTDPPSYCGAMKLCEALIGQDQLGFHPRSVFKSDGTDAGGTQIYANPNVGFAALDLTDVSIGGHLENYRARRRYLEAEDIKSAHLYDLYGSIGTFAAADNLRVFCDVYNRVTDNSTGKRIGMPILYYKADISKTLHNVLNANDPENIYNYLDNDGIVALGTPFGVGVHPMAGTERPEKFYEETRNPKITTLKPYRADTYILMSAGFDGLYGTADDVFNFED